MGIGTCKRTPAAWLAELGESEALVPSPEEILRDALEWACAELEVDPDSLGIGVHDPDSAVAVARLVNRAAKVHGDYSHKPAAFGAAARTPGVEYGWQEWEQVFYVRGPLGPATAAHDPWGELRWELARQGVPYRSWPEDWDGRVLQPYAVALAAGLPVRRQRALRQGREARL